MILTEPSKINLFAMMSLRSRLGLELKGLKSSGRSARSAYALIKETYNLKGSKQRVYEQFTALIEAKKIMEML